MIICAVTLGVLGVVCLFLPQEIAAVFGFPDSGSIAFQMLGALFFGFAMINWIAKSNIIGGIYGRPIAMGNFAQFFIGALVLLKLLIKEPSGIIILILSILYTVFAILFGLILFRPAKLPVEAEVDNSI